MEFFRDDPLNQFQAQTVLELHRIMETVQGYGVCIAAVDSRRRPRVTAPP